jgi:hypothetical protein
MAEGRSETLWQQGFVLNPDSATKLGLTHPDPRSETMVVLVTHDCDLVEAPQVEPECEIIVGRKIKAVDGRFTKARNPRLLHLSFSGGAERIVVELLATDKRRISKQDILSQPFRRDIRLTQDEHFDLQLWLAARYHRPIFPDEFDRRLKAKPAEVHRKIANLIKGSGTDVIALLFDIDAGREIEHEADDPYVLEILVVHSVSEDPGKAFDTGNRLASQIRGLFRQYFQKDGQSHAIHLTNCLAVSAEAVSINRFRSLKPWNYSYAEIVAES